MSYRTLGSKPHREALSYRPHRARDAHRHEEAEARSRSNSASSRRPYSREKERGWVSDAQYLDSLNDAGYRRYRDDTKEYGRQRSYSSEKRGGTPHRHKSSERRSTSRHSDRVSDRLSEVLSAARREDDRLFRERLGGSSSSSVRRQSTSNAAPPRLGGEGYRSRNLSDVRSHTSSTAGNGTWRDRLARLHQEIGEYETDRTTMTLQSSSLSGDGGHHPRQQRQAAGLRNGKGVEDLLAELRSEQRYNALLQRGLAVERRSYTPSNPAYSESTVDDPSPRSLRSTSQRRRSSASGLSTEEYLRLSRRNKAWREMLTAREKEREKESPVPAPAPPPAAYPASVSPQLPNGTADSALLPSPPSPPVPPAPIYPYSRDYSLPAPVNGASPPRTSPQAPIAPRDPLSQTVDSLEVPHNHQPIPSPPLPLTKSPDQVSGGSVLPASPLQGNVWKVHANVLSRDETVVVDAQGSDTFRLLKLRLVPKTSIPADSMMLLLGTQSVEDEFCLRDVQPTCEFLQMPPEVFDPTLSVSLLDKREGTQENEGVPRSSTMPQIPVADLVDTYTNQLRSLEDSITKEVDALEDADDQLLATSPAPLSPDPVGGSFETTPPASPASSASLRRSFSSPTVPPIREKPAAEWFGHIVTAHNGTIPVQWDNVTGMPSMGPAVFTGNQILLSTTLPSSVPRTERVFLEFYSRSDTGFGVEVKSASGVTGARLTPVGKQLTEGLVGDVTWDAVKGKLSIRPGGAPSLLQGVCVKLQRKDLRVWTAVVSLLVLVVWAVFDLLSSTPDDLLDSDTEGGNLFLEDLGVSLLSFVSPLLDNWLYIAAAAALLCTAALIAAFPSLGKGLARMTLATLLYLLSYCKRALAFLLGHAAKRLSSVLLDEEPSPKARRG